MITPEQARAEFNRNHDKQYQDLMKRVHIAIKKASEEGKGSIKEFIGNLDDDGKKFVGQRVANYLTMEGYEAQVIPHIATYGYYLKVKWAEPEPVEPLKEAEPLVELTKVEKEPTFWEKIKGLWS